MKINYCKKQPDERSYTSEWGNLMLKDIMHYARANIKCIEIIC